MNGKDYDFRNDTGTYQTGRTEPPRRYGGFIAFLIVLVILLSGISTALSIMNLKLYWQLNTPEKDPRLTFFRAEEEVQATEEVVEEVRALQSHLGIGGTMIPEVYLRFYGLPNGVYVSQVCNHSEAQEKGIIAGDIITALDGHPIENMGMLESLSEAKEDGDPVELTLYRAGVNRTLQLIWSEY